MMRWYEKTIIVIIQMAIMWMPVVGVLRTLKDVMSAEPQDKIELSAIGIIFAITAIVILCKIIIKVIFEEDKCNK